MSAVTPPNRRTDVSGTDPDEAIQLFEAGYNGNGFIINRTELEFSYRHAATGENGVTLRSSKVFGEITGEIEPEGEYIVQWIKRGTATVDVHKDNVRLTLGSPVMFPTGRPFSFSYRDYEQDLVHLDKDLVDRIAREREGAVLGSLRFTPSVAPVSQAALRAWNATLQLVAQTLLAGSPSPLLEAEMSRLAASALLDAFAHRQADIGESLLLPSGASLRVAVEFIHANAEQPLTATSIAKAAGLSVRGLQQSFARQLDTTPTAYVRSVRLDRTREDLQLASPNSTTVAEIAQKWGFVHLGRFSAAYTERFGEYPSTTLRS
ncbi:AraC family transcriptional regulator [Frondihabitans cladoniiphilus]|uniref:HTH araC/xylS-type domain-containing protein n=1 Tax=Frondihabitans cladoniiphilus TaxID=715785 RepID=A0ABP8W4C3_9MICO